VKVVQRKDPTLDINNAESIVFVMKNGGIVDESQLPPAGGNQKRRFTESATTQATPIRARFKAFSVQFE
jgi:hypothetical protein